MQTTKLPQYTIGSNVLEHLGKMCAGYGRRVLVAGGKTALEKTQTTVIASLQHAGIQDIEILWYGGECSLQNIEMVRAKALDTKADFIIGIGGGKALDTAKAAAEKAGLPIFTVPTIASTCAATTMLSIIYTNHGDYECLYQLNSRPVHILIDTHIIANAPVRYLWAGIGDTLSKYYEVEITTRGRETPHSVSMGKALSIMCVEPLVDYSVKALADAKDGNASFALQEIILNIIITTGIVSTLVGDPYAGACAHGLFYGLTTLESIEKNHLHGEVVAYGVLVLLVMDGRTDELKRLYSFYKSIGLPVSLKDIEVENDRAHLDPVLDKAVQAEDTGKVCYPVTKEMFWEAIQKLEAFSQEIN